jgi:hypothetical protein
MLSEILGTLLGRLRDSVVLRLRGNGQTAREVIDTIAALTHWLEVASYLIRIHGHDDAGVPYGLERGLIHG